MGIDVITSSSYNSQSQGLSERMVGIFKEQLKKAKATLSQLHVDEMVFELNARETSNGSTLDRFLGKGLRWDRYVDARDLIRQRQEVTKIER